MTVPSSQPEFQFDRNAVDLTQSSYDSTDESSFDDDTADLLINMPILDLGEKEGAEKTSEKGANEVSTTAESTPVTISPGSPKHISVPTVSNHSVNSNVDENDDKMDEEMAKGNHDFVLPLGVSTRRVSLEALPPPFLGDEMKEMEDIFNMLDEDDNTFSEKAS